MFKKTCRFYPFKKTQVIYTKKNLDFKPAIQKTCLNSRFIMVYAAMSNLSVYSAAKLTNKTACNFQFFVSNKKIDAMVIF